MSVFRLTHVPFEQNFNVHKDLDTLDSHEWEDSSRTQETGWSVRYEYEASLVKEIIANGNAKTVLEIGSGPGHLSQLVQKDLEVEYHLVDKPFADKYFKEHNFKGKFFVKDIALDLDTTGLLPTYDLIVCNDVLEHLLAPTNVLRKIHSLLNENSQVLISVPNWRMGHQFLYRGLWDYDNVLYFFYIHGLSFEGVYPSPLQTPDYPLLPAMEDAMPEELRRSWNWYFVLKKKYET